MKCLTIESFTAKETDIELNQYKILAGLKEYRAEFNKNRLYPALSELVYLSSQLEEILERKGGVGLPLPKGIKNSHKEKNVFVEVIDQAKEQKEYFKDLIEWAIPVIKSLIDEAYMIYNFVDENMTIEEVGIRPILKNEGYILVPDNVHSILQVHRYECSTYSSGDMPFHSLKTRFIQTYPQLNFSTESEFVKIDLVKKYRDRPNIAAYLCNTELDFPFQETIFPVAKRKLLDYITD